MRSKLRLKRPKNGCCISLCTIVLYIAHGIPTNAVYTAGAVYICRAYIEEAGGGSVQPSGRDSTLAPTVDALSILAAEKGDDDDEE